MKADTIIINKHTFGHGCGRSTLFEMCLICPCNIDEHLEFSKGFLKRMKDLRVKPRCCYSGGTNHTLVKVTLDNSQITLEEILEVFDSDALAIAYASTESVDIKKTLGLLRIEVDTTSAVIKSNN